jgi:hypothetical protein
VRSSERRRRTRAFSRSRRQRFIEEDAAGTQVAQRELELVRPRPVSLNTVVAAVVCRSGGRVFLGVDDEDRPAAQCFDGHSNLIVAPAYRLAHDVGSVSAIKRVLRSRLAESSVSKWERSGSLAATTTPLPERLPKAVYPMAVEAMGDRSREAPSDLGGTRGVARDACAPSRRPPPGGRVPRGPRAGLLP